MAATTVFPEPTSPCKILFIGLGFSISFKMCHAAFFWASVNSKESFEVKRFIISGAKTTTGAFTSESFFRSVNTNKEMKKSSSKAKRFLARSASFLLFGKWIAFKALLKGGRPCSLSRNEGSVSRMFVREPKTI